MISRPSDTCRNILSIMGYNIHNVIRYNPALFSFENKTITANKYNSLNCNEKIVLIKNHENVRDNFSHVKNLHLKSLNIVVIRTGKLLTLQSSF